MNIIFMGTPEFAAFILKALADRHHVQAVVSQPDKPAGRGLKTKPSPVKQLARSLRLPVLQPEKLRGEAINALKSYGPDVIVTAAYGKILPKEVLDLPPFGCINGMYNILCVSRCTYT